MVKGTYFQNSREAPLVYGDVEIINPLRRKLRGLEEATAEITGTTDIGGTGVACGFDVCIEAVGLPSTFQNCIDAAAFGGKVVLIGVGKQNLDFNFTLLQKKELNVFGSRNALKKDFLELIDLVKSGRWIWRRLSPIPIPSPKRRKLSASSAKTAAGC